MDFANKHGDIDVDQKTERRWCFPIFATLPSGIDDVIFFGDGRRIPPTMNHHFDAPMFKKWILCQQFVTASHCWALGLSKASCTLVSGQRDTTSLRQGPLVVQGSGNSLLKWHDAVREAPQSYLNWCQSAAAVIHRIGWKMLKGKFTESLMFGVTTAWFPADFS